MDDLCTACLCTGRNLYFIGDTGFYQIYSEILNEIPVYNISDICIRVCWECRAALRRFNNFKHQVKSCYTELMQFVHQVEDTKLTPPSRSRLQIEVQTSTSCPEIKIEYDSLRVDDDDAFHDDSSRHFEQLETEGYAESVKEEQHLEPVTFANEFDVIDKKENTEDENIKPTKEKKKKDKLKKNIKVKRKKKNKLNSTNKSTYNNEECNITSTEEKMHELERDERLKAEKDLRRKRKCDNYEAKNEMKIEVPVKIPAKRVRSSEVPSSGLGSEKPECAECGKVFSSRKTLRYHLNVLHKGNNRYPCPRCGKVYQWKSNLGRHLRSHKARESGELYCEMCDKRFASVATYRQHLAVSKQHVSENEFSFTCSECGKKFVNKTRLRDHIDWEHLQKIKFRCQLCNKPFKCHTSLYVHMKNVHRNKGLKDNLCHVCGKSYQNRAKLRYHIVAMHTTETPYQCEQCSAAFGWYSSLYRHVREVHYKMKLQPNKSKKTKKKGPETLPPLLQQPHMMLPPLPQPGLP